MKIICDPEHMPSKGLLAKMSEGGRLCAETEGVDADRIEVSLTFVGSTEIQELNQIYRGKDEVTDVLSFPQYDSAEGLPEEGQLLLGDVVICTEQALLQADDFGHSDERELVYLFIHSILHLLGHDHMREEEKAAMREREETILTEIGVER